MAFRQGRVLVGLVTIVAVVFGAITLAPTARAGLPAGFQETVVFSGLTNPTAVRFASDGRVFVAEKSGRIKVFDNLADSTPTLFADLSTNVYNYWDRGLLGLALHPNFPLSPYVYVLYTHDAEIGGTAPKWGTPGILSDPCPDPPGANKDGCVASGRLSRLTASGHTMTGPEEVLIEDYCQQYPSLSVGSLVFGPDGALYATGGTASSFTFNDWGQAGNPRNPCGDPPGGVGSILSPPSAEGGSLRGQDLRTTGDPVGLDGTLIRIDPMTGAARSDNPLAGNPDANARRIVSYGLRNPFRLTVRPGTNEIWFGDVGTGNYEEINRVVSPTDTLVENFGWPCYEGPNRQPGFDAADLTLCESLYAEGASARNAPYFSYAHKANVSNETCPNGSSSISGLAFYSGSSYPAQYSGALFFADYSRSCMWVVFKGANGLPDLATRTTFADPAAGPVDIQAGPGGDLFYVDFNGGTVRRITYGSGEPPPPPPPPPGGVVYLSDLDWTSMTNGWGPAEKDMSNGGSAAGDGRTLTLKGVTYEKGLGVHAVSEIRYSIAATCTRFRSDVGTDDEVAASTRPSVVFAVYADGIKLYDSGVVRPTTPTRTVDVDVTGKSELRLVVSDAGDGVDSDHADWAGARLECGQSEPTNSPPTPTIAAPSGTSPWSVGEVISFSGSATDPEDGALPASALSWALILHHCPETCHTHSIQTFEGVGSGSFSTPDHEFPSHLELRLTAMDSGGLTSTKSVQLNPRTVSLTLASDPSGLRLVLNGTSGTAPFTSTVIAGSTNTISAPSPQTLFGTDYVFWSWSDDRAASHNVTVTGSSTFTATYVAAPSPPRNAVPPSISGTPRVGQTLTANAGVWSGELPMSFAYQWHRCNAGGKNCTPIAGAGERTYVPTLSDVGLRLRVVVTATNSLGSSSATSEASAKVTR